MFGISGEPKELSRCTVLESLKWLTLKNRFSSGKPLYAFEAPRHGPSGPSGRQKTPLNFLQYSFDLAFSDAIHVCCLTNRHPIFQPISDSR